MTDSGMDDLISRAAAIDAIYNSMRYGEGYKSVCARAICRLPAVDAVPVVRCRDCVYGCLSKNARGEGRVFCENPDIEGMDYLVNEPDWYCADGERRESE